MTAPVLLDLFGCEGVGAAGYAAAGWRVLSVDNDAARARHNPYSWFVGDWRDGLVRALATEDVAAVHASPPCQGYSATACLAAAQGSTVSESDLVGPVRNALDRSGLPYLLENVERSPVRPDVVLCGSMFGLDCKRHRVFESNAALDLAPMVCRHDTFPPDTSRCSPEWPGGKPRPWGVYGAFRDEIPSGGRTVRSTQHAREVLGLEVFGTHKVTQQGLRESIPPAYTYTLGRALMRAAAPALAVAV